MSESIEFVYLVWDSSNYTGPLGVFKTENEAREFLLGFIQTIGGKGYQHIYKLPFGIEVTGEDKQIACIPDGETSFLR